ncbi:MAG: hypothetical protein R3C11_26035 [Planctomycetaceae bacterium]
MSADTSPDDSSRLNSLKSGHSAKVFFRVALALRSSGSACFLCSSLLTANPVTLNWEQIRRSQTVILAKVVNKDAGTVEVERFWKNDPHISRRDS